MAERRAARRVNGTGQARLDDDAPLEAPRPTETNAPPPAPPAAEPPPARAPLDLEASRRALEARQLAWFRFRAEWMRRRAERSKGSGATGTPPSPEDPRPNP